MISPAKLGAIRCASSYNARLFCLPLLVLPTAFARFGRFGSGAPGDQ